MNKEGSRKTHIDGIKAFFRITDCKDLKICLKNYNKIRKLIDTSKSTKSPYGLYDVNSKRIYLAAVLLCVDKFYIPINKETHEKYRIWFDELKYALTKKTRQIKHHLTQMLCR